MTGLSGIWSPLETVVEDSPGDIIIILSHIKGVIFCLSWGIILTALYFDISIRAGEGLPPPPAPASRRIISLSTLQRSQEWLWVIAIAAFSYLSSVGNHNHNPTTHKTHKGNSDVIFRFLRCLWIILPILACVINLLFILRNIKKISLASTNYFPAQCDNTVVGVE